MKSTARFAENIEAGFVSHAERLDEQTYAKVLDCIVVTCVDIVVTHTTKVLLGKRAHYPQKDWWVIGGRMIPGESIGAAGQRNIKRELGIMLQPERFEYLTSVSAAWTHRQQEPQDHGAHTVSLVTHLELSPDEQRQLRYNEEYAELSWIEIREALQRENLHPGLRHCLQVISEKIFQQPNPEGTP